MFGEVIAEVLRYDKELQISSMISNKKRTMEEKESAKNAKKLIKFATQMIDGIIENKNSIPTQMVSLLQRIDAKMKSTFTFAPDDVIKTTGIASVLFEKFYCRAIAAPDAAGLTEGKFRQLDETSLENSNEGCLQNLFHPPQDTTWHDCLLCLKTLPWASLLLSRLCMNSARKILSRLDR